jgi:hypothetical protein
MAMAKLKKLSVDRESAESWHFVLRIEDDSGATLRLTANFDDLDAMSAALDEQFNAIVEAAEKLEAQKASMGVTNHE